MQRSLLVLILIINSPFLHAQQNNWQLAQGTAGRWILDVEPCPTNPDSVYALIDSAGPKLMLSTDRGESWHTQTRQPALAAFFGAIVPDARDSKVVYASYSQTTPTNWNNTVVEMTTNGGMSWQLLSSIQDPIGSVVAERNPLAQTVVFLGAGWGKILRTRDRGQSWDSLGVLPDTAGPTALAIAASDTNIMYASSVDYLYKTTNSGASWFTIAIFPRWVSSVAVHPQNPDTVYVTIFDSFGPPGGVYKSTDGGTTWNESSNGIPANTRNVYTVVINPKTPTDLYAAVTEVYRSTDGGSNWSDVQVGFPNQVGPTCITIDTATNRIYVGTNGGIYLGNLITSVSSGEPPRPHSVVLHQNYPNPFNPNTYIKYAVPARSHVSVIVYDMLGRRVEILLNQVVETGEYQLQFHGDGLPSGVYLYRLSKGATSITRKMLLLR